MNIMLIGVPLIASIPILSHFGLLQDQRFFLTSQKPLNMPRWASTFFRSCYCCHVHGLALQKVGAHHCLELSGIGCATATTTILAAQSHHPTWAAFFLGQSNYFRRKLDPNKSPSSQVAFATHWPFAHATHAAHTTHATHATHTTHATRRFTTSLAHFPCAMGKSTGISTLTRSLRLKEFAHHRLIVVRGACEPSQLSPRCPPLSHTLTLSVSISTLGS